MNLKIESLATKIRLPGGRLRSSALVLTSLRVGTADGVGADDVDVDDVKGGVVGFAAATRHRLLLKARTHSKALKIRSYVLGFPILLN